jgi:acetyl-CoA carboxylase biotin carboxylase subunit
MFKKLLIANRGEIACRVIRACREAGIKTVAVYSDPDRHSLHVRMADEAFHIGPAASAESYLRGDKIVDVALRAGADAIHPGYGFLSENAEFSRMVEHAGISFVGPPASVMELMGGKISARKVAVEAGVPIVPGATEPVVSFDDALDTARQIGFPVMLKASAGGGGKGMRLVLSENDFRSALETAQSEALASFGDASVYLEKAVLKPRHIEIQIFSDKHGNHVHLGERECSIQRRHQKVIEECPSPINSPDLRAKMGEAAVKIARAVDYVGAGTVEFLVSDVDRSFYFLEMNTRLQVEHPVTEMVTGIDLVREQLGVASGRELSFRQEDISWNGHAIECRIYAEDPDDNFMPSPGRITRLRIPQGSGIRDDGGVYEGAEVSIYYDPMISKFATFGATRTEALERMRRALQEYHVGGIKTTIPFFREVMNDEEFISGELDTGFISRFQQRRVDIQPSETSKDLAIIAAVLAWSKRKIGGDNLRTDKEGEWASAARTIAFKNRL